LGSKIVTATLLVKDFEAAEIQEIFPEKTENSKKHSITSSKKRKNSKIRKTRAFSSSCDITSISHRQRNLNYRKIPTPPMMHATFVVPLRFSANE
jgi:hypothetical protein